MLTGQYPASRKVQNMSTDHDSFGFFLPSSLYLLSPLRVASYTLGIYHSSQSLQHFAYAVHRYFVLALETHYCRSLRTSFLYYFDTE
jgi:hypothetical protein